MAHFEGCCTESYRINTLGLVRPVISNAKIEAAIADLFDKNRWADGLPSVREVGRHLQVTHGRKAATDRIRAALNAIRGAASDTATDQSPDPVQTSKAWVAKVDSLSSRLAKLEADSKARIDELESRLREAESRAMRAEEREQAQQDHWAEKLYELKSRLREALVGRPNAITPDQYLAVHRDLKAARDRIEILEGELAQRSSSPAQGD